VRRRRNARLIPLPTRRASWRRRPDGLRPDGQARPPEPSGRFL